MFHLRPKNGQLYWKDSATNVSTSPVYVIEKQIDDMGIELPRINEERTGRPYRFLYAAEQPTCTEMRGIVRYDLERGSMQRYRVPEGDQNSEPVFVSRRTASAEDDGWVLVCVYRHATNTSDVVILDGRNIASDPVATVRLPRRIPAGFHGAWLPREEGAHEAG